MKVKIYKPALAILAVCLLTVPLCLAQAAPAQLVQPEQTQSAGAIQLAAGPMPAENTAVTLKPELNWLSAQVNNLKSVIASANNEARDAVRESNVSETISAIITKNYTSANSDEVQDNQTSKSYSKTYAADADDKLVIDNSYGSVTINTWDKNSIKVDVEVHASAKNSEDEKDILDGVTISDAKDGSTVAFKTNINSGKSIWRTIFDGNGQHSLSINYTVYMPAKNELILRNRYGNIELSTLNGHVTLDCAYGSIHGGSLTGESAIRERYGNIDLQNMGTTAIDLSSGNLSLAAVNRIQANASYSGININKLRESGAFNVRYGGGLKIEDMDKSVSNLAVNTSYSSVNVGLSGDEDANFDITVHYGDFNYHDHAVTLTGNNDRGSSSTKSYKGYVGKGASNKSISINASYGSVQFD